MLGRQHFNSYVAVETGLISFVNGGHATGANKFDNAILAESLPEKAHTIPTFLAEMR